MHKTESAQKPSTETAPDIALLRNAARAAEPGLRVLHDVEMAWIGGADGAPVWPY